MPPTRMFRDRMVSMEQTLEGGEKNLEFLKGVCKEAFPEFEYREHVLDHERDLFLMRLESGDGRRKTVAWTRMMLFDAERLPALVDDPISPLKSRLLAFLQARAARPEVVVTFRHLEEGWVDTPEPRREGGRRRRRGGRGRGRDREQSPERGGERRGQQPQPTSPRERRPGGQPSPERRPGGAPERRPGGQSGPPQRQGQPRGPQPPRPAAAAAEGAAAGEPGGAGKRRRRFRRRRRGRGGAGGGGGAGPAGPGASGPPGAPS
jgi:hypothetical protein